MIPSEIKPTLFNTPLEAGLRAVIILETFEPSRFDIATISLLDYYLVHTADAGGPESIHPEISARRGEYYVRRHLVEQGIALMMRCSLIEQIPTPSGIMFQSHETAAALLDLIGTSYNKKLIAAAQWLAKKGQEDGQEKLIYHLKVNIDRWSQEMIGASVK